MRRSPVRFVVFAGLSLLTVCALADEGLPAGPYIQVSGHGELHLAPDMASLSLTIEKTAPDAAQARADVETRAARVIALARRLGIADRDIAAPAVTVYPDYEWKDDVQHLVGQHVTRRVTLTLRELGRYGELVDGLFAAGVTRLDSVTPDVSDREAEERQALALAVKNARDKAAGLATSAGVTLGPVYSIVEQGGGGSPRPMFAMAKAGSEALSPPPAEYLNGEIELDADVLVYYLIGK